MFKRSCDNCKKAVKEDYISIDLQLKSTGKYGRYDICIGCVKSVGKFVELTVSEKKKR